jgi:hypothetical protein
MAVAHQAASQLAANITQADKSDFHANSAHFYPHAGPNLPAGEGASQLNSLAGWVKNIARQGWRRPVSFLHGSFGIAHLCCPCLHL